MFCINLALMVWLMAVLVYVPLRRRFYRAKDGPGASLVRPAAVWSRNGR
jgi:hypothetical protein